MIKFVNAKLNLGLSVVRRREDGYHELETIFYPVGKYNGTPENPEPFCDILEITVRKEGQVDKIELSGEKVDSRIEDNLVVKALRSFRKACEERGIETPTVLLSLDKHLPSGAGLGGGSADASFTLTALNEVLGHPLSKEILLELALGLGADCPFFIENRPVYATGIGEKFEEINLNLDRYWALIVRPTIFVSTKEAFQGIKPMPSEFDLRQLSALPVKEWKDKVKNDFETTIFPLHPELSQIKQQLYAEGAEYASMSGSGSTLFGLFPDRESAKKASSAFSYQTFLCKL